MPTEVDSPSVRPVPSPAHAEPSRPLRRSLKPGSWLGLLGGGQLGRMFAIAAQTLGFRVVTLDPDAHGPAVAVSDRHLCADYADPAALTDLAQRAAAVTTEFENVPASSLSFLAQTLRVYPGADCVSIAQDRIAEKAFIAESGLAPVPYAVIRNEVDLDQFGDTLLPGILKAARLGYDGKGQVRVATRSEVRQAFAAMGGVPCVLEKRVDLAYELSVVLARSAVGETKTYPVAQNIHRDGILAVSIVPSARIAPEIALRARDAALTMAERMQYVGVLCVEFFVLADGQLCVNEMAPRPHNSGHYSIDACLTSQFEQQVRILAELPLGAPDQHSPAVMLNLLGDLWFASGRESAEEPDWPAVLALSGVTLHLYGKREARRGRKMGHLTILAGTSADARASALRAAEILGIEPWP